MKVTEKTLFAGRDFPSFFEDDLFSLRRSGTAFAAGNPYDPESLLTGGEIQNGLTYTNSRRNWPDEATYLEAVGGGMTREEILRIAPRAFLEPEEKVDLRQRLMDVVLGPRFSEAA